MQTMDHRGAAPRIVSPRLALAELWTFATRPLQPELILLGLDRHLRQAMRMLKFADGEPHLLALAGALRQAAELGPVPRPHSEPSSVLFASVRPDNRSPDDADRATLAQVRSLLEPVELTLLDWFVLGRDGRSHSVAGLAVGRPTW